MKNVFRTIGTKRHTGFDIKKAAKRFCRGFGLTVSAEDGTADMSANIERYNRCCEEFRGLEKRDRMSARGMCLLSGLAKAVQTKETADYFSQHEKHVLSDYRSVDGIKEYGVKLLDYVENSLSNCGTAEAMQVGAYNGFILPMLYMYKKLSEETGRMFTEHRNTVIRMEKEIFDFMEGSSASIPSLGFRGCKALLEECRDNEDNRNYAHVSAFEDAVRRLNGRVEQNEQVLEYYKNLPEYSPHDYKLRGVHIIVALDKLFGNNRTACFERADIAPERYRKNLIEFTEELKNELIDKY